MPILSRFFGIVIYMYWRDHMPAHFHAKYQDQEITVDVVTGEVTGQMNRRAMGIIQEWRSLYMSELLENWSLALERKSLHPIKPLE